MCKFFFSIFFLLIAGGDCFALADEASETKLPKSITIGFIPSGDPKLIQSQAMLFGEKLQEVLGIPISIFISKDYEGLTQAMREKKVDFAFMSAMSYVSAESTVQVKVLLKKVWVEPYYFAAIVTLAKSKIRTISGLRGVKLAFVDEKSTSGYLYPWVMLGKNKFARSDFREVSFSGSHATSVEWLTAKKVDAIAVFTDDPKGKTGAWTKFSKLPGRDFRTLWVSEPIPNDPFTVRKDFYDQYPKFTHTLMISLIDLFQSNREKKIFSEVLGNHDLMPATSRQYDPVREMVKTLGGISR